ncbi:nickel/cobalt transporter [Shimia sp. MIT910701]|uniref:nickel/cobalt transporter n=1 Tax=Shimia sp. MIT910701 TaxID=3096987 RepID=UPI003999ECB2
MRTIAVLAILALLFGGALMVIDFDAIAQWAATEQRGFQNGMADAIRALRMGQTEALLALFAGAAAYGFFHAVGPGHGKALIGGVGLGTQVSASRLLLLSVASSLAQSLWAIVLVYGGFWILEVSANHMTALAEDFLAPLSYLAIASVGALLVWRGARSLPQATAQHHDADHHHHNHDHHSDHDHSDCGCHAHGPSPSQVAQLSSLRETVALITSIAIRPCTGAIFLLVIAWQMDLHLAGVLAVLVMGLGTASFTGLVAVSSVAARTAALASADNFKAAGVAFAGLQVLTGLVVIWMSLSLLRYTL